jgi:hypothetical protein
MADARHRGARTASLQSTEMGRPLYESLHFEPAGRYRGVAMEAHPAPQRLGAGLPCRPPHVSDTDQPMLGWP